MKLWNFTPNLNESSMSQYSRRGFAQNICNIRRWFWVSSATMIKYAKKKLSELFWYKRSLNILQRPKTDQKHQGQDRLSHLAVLCIKHAYISRLDVEKVIDEFSSKNVHSKLFFQPVFIPDNLSNLFWIL